jgi:hypothetical protein
MFIKKRFIIIILVSFLLGISGAGLESPAYADEDTYEKVWDSGNTISNRVREVEVGDMDGDGHPEIIVSDQPPGGGGKIYVFENTGDNSYEPVWDSGTTLTMRIGRIAIGDLDMVLHFKTQETGIQYGNTTACLTGIKMDGKSIEGCDDIVTVGKGKK